MEGLKLIDLGNEVSYIDVDTSKVPYTFSVKLGDRTFAFSIRYNEVGGFFTVDLSIASTGEVLMKNSENTAPATLSSLVNVIKILSPLNLRIRFILP